MWGGECLNSRPLGPTLLHFVQEFASPGRRSTCFGASLAIQNWPDCRWGQRLLPNSRAAVGACRSGKSPTAVGRWSESARGPRSSRRQGRVGAHGDAPTSTCSQLHSPHITRHSRHARWQQQAAHCGMCVSQSQRGTMMQRGVREAAAEQDFGTVPRVLETPEGRNGEETGRGSRQRERQGRKEKGFPGALSESRSVVSDSLRPRGLYSLRSSPGQDTGVGSHSLLQGIFPTQGSNPGLPHCRQILSQLSHKGSPQGALAARTLPVDAGAARDAGSIRGRGRAPREGSGNPLQYSCLKSSMDAGAWRATVHGVA